MWNVKSYLKFFLKVRIIANVRRVLIALLGAPINRNGWDRRVLIIHLAGLGDVVMMTGALKHYKEAWPDREIALLVGRVAALPKEFVPGVDVVLALDYRALSLNPWYGLKQANMLRTKGFKTVVVGDPSAAEVVGKEFATLLGAEELIGYEGPRLQYDRPLDANMARGVKETARLLRIKYTDVPKSVDWGKPINERLTNFLRHYAAIFSAATGKPAPEDLAPRLTIPEIYRSAVRDILRKEGITKPFILVTLGTSTEHREWPSERFAPLVQYAALKGYEIVLVGSPRERALADKFKAAYQGAFHDLIGKTSLPEYVALFDQAAGSLSNCTGAVHISIALKRPSFAILGAGHIGMVSWYGYSDINMWSYDEEIGCHYDNWRCIAKVGPHDPMPCFASQTVEKVLPKWKALIDYLVKTSNVPIAKFMVEISLPTTLHKRQNNYEYTSPLK